MKRKTQKNDDMMAVMTKVQEQLAVLDHKLDSFMTKSLTDLAQALAASKPAPTRPLPVATPGNTPTTERLGSRPMYAVVCFECGDDCEIPFKPSGNRPVYCKKCFAKRKGSSAQSSAPGAQINSAPVSMRLAPSTASIIDSKTKKKTAAKKKTVAQKKTTAKRKSVSTKKKLKK